MKNSWRYLRQPAFKLQNSLPQHSGCQSVLVTKSLFDAFAQEKYFVGCRIEKYHWRQVSELQVGERGAFAARRSCSWALEVVHGDDGVQAPLIAALTGWGAQWTSSWLCAQSSNSGSMNISWLVYQTIFVIVRKGSDQKARQSSLSHWNSDKKKKKKYYNRKMTSAKNDESLF